VAGGQEEAWQEGEGAPPRQLLLVEPAAGAQMRVQRPILPRALRFLQLVGIRTAFMQQQQSR